MTNQKGDITTTEVSLLVDRVISNIYCVAKEVDKEHIRNDIFVTQWQATDTIVGQHICVPCNEHILAQILGNVLK